MTVVYTGLSRRGQHNGTLSADTDIAKFVRSCHKAGWHELTVMRDGEQIAGIATADNGKRRAWWSE